MKKLTDSNPKIQYLSGVFDIGGCVRIETPRKGEKSCLYIWITHPNFELMEVLQSLGGYVSRKTDGQYRAKWKDLRAYQLLKLMIPHLILRKDQAKCGLEFFEVKLSKPDTYDQDEVICRLRLKLLKKSEEDI